MFVDELRKALNAASCSGKEIAEAADVHPVNLSQFKTGKRNALPPEQMDRLAKVIGMSIKLIPAPKKK